MIRNSIRAVGTLAVMGLLSNPVIAQTVTISEPAQTPMTTEMGTTEMGMGATIIFGNLEFSGAFTRAMPPTAVSGGGFVTIKNTGAEDDRLVSASSMVSAHVETHIMSMDGDVMKMQSRPEGFVIPAGGTLELKPGGKHLMFIGVEKPFVEGENIKVTLVFERGGRVELMLHAIPVGAMAMEHTNMDHGSMDHSTMNAETTSN